MHPEPNRRVGGLNFAKFLVRLFSIYLVSSSGNVSGNYSCHD